ncbi:hypothetical protein LEP1GSC128_1943 [Leptospira borgpetersenii str. 200801926]|uniref:Uncharacterized protein n=1 Tax=Leptospira borgpetersenii str. 200801926 TaxID=1193009 RepID=A0ABP2S5P2_LEPBO|nr:hypothetical protein LEP1GSC128_1943 [Leptospira borgpetersenii str. 200801926]
MKEVELKKKLESITFQVTLGVVQKSGKGIWNLFLTCRGYFPITWKRGRIEKGCNPAETVVVYLLGP